MDNEKRTRRQLREDIVIRLYEMDINNEFTPSETGYPFVDETLENIIKHKDKIDEFIQTNLTKWKLGRLSYVDRAILRFATYELWLTDTPSEIIINEALNITRKYSDEGDDKTVGFNNKVLDTISKYVKKVG
jgi:N utilization substance protein B